MLLSPLNVRTALALALTLVFSSPAFGGVTIRFRVQDAGRTPLPQSIPVFVLPVLSQQKGETSYVCSLAMSCELPRLNAAGETWRVAAVAPGYWSADRIIETSAENRSFVFDLYPASRIQGQVIADVHDSHPNSIAIAFSSAGSETMPSGEITCPTRDNEFDCVFPAGVYDVKLKSRGYLPHYLWGLEFKAGAVRSITPFPLVKGAALTGYVRVPRGKRPDSVKLTARPEAGDIPYVGESRIKALALAVNANEKGFFEFDGIPPGIYVVDAATTDLASEPTRVKIIEGAEAELASPLVLMTPEPVTVNVTPAVDPTGQQWRARLTSTRGGTVGAARVTEAGVVTFNRILPGEYRLSILSGDSTWYGDAIKVTPAMPITHVELPVVPIHGSVHLGERPLAASLAFGGLHGSVSVPIRSAADGSYSGFLPHDGEWTVDVTSEAADIHGTSVEAKVHRRDTEEAALVDIALSGNVISGSVILNGSPVPNALVHAQSGGSSLHVNADEGGNFRFEGLRTGSLELRAEHHGGYMSDVVTREIDADSKIGEVVLELKRSPYINGRVISDGGPVPGAIVYAFSLSDPQPVFAPVATAADGSFRIRLAPGAQTAGVVVATMGFALHAASIAVTGDIVAVPVHQDGGRLILNFPKVPPDPPVIMHNGVPLFFEILVSWAARQGQQIRRDRSVITNVEQGAYTVCTPTSRVGAGALRSGQQPADQCVSGFVAAGADLALSVPVE